MRQPEASVTRSGRGRISAISSLSGSRWPNSQIAIARMQSRIGFFTLGNRTPLSR